MNIYPYVIIIAFLVFFTLIIPNFKRIKKSIKTNKKTLLFLAVLVLGGLLLRIAVFNPKISIFSASWEHNLAAKEFAHNGILMTCAKGTFSKCTNPMVIHHPSGYAIILSVFLLMGASLKQMLLVQVIVNALTAVIVFFTIFISTRQKIPSFLGSAIFLFSNVSYSCASFAGGASAIFNNFFIAIALFLLFYASKNNTRKARALALASIALIPLFLIENILTLALLVLGIFLFWEYNSKKAREDALGLLFIASTTLTLLLLIFWIWIENGHIEKAFNNGMLSTNLVHLLEIWFHRFSPFIFLLPITWGLMILNKSTKKAGVLFGAWFLLFNLLFLLFRLGPNLRYLQVTVIPFSIVSGIGSSLLIQKINKKSKAKNIGLVLTFLFLFLAVYPAISAHKTRNLFNSSDDLLETINLIKGKENIYVFVATNTAWEAIQRTEKKYFATSSFLNQGDFEKEMYFIDTGKCSQPFWKKQAKIKNTCRVMKENSHLVLEYKGIKVYKVNRDESSRKKILKYSCVSEATK